MPVMDIELYNDTGQDIVVSGIAGAEKTVSIPQRKSKPLDLLTIQQGQPEKLAVMTPTASWFYPHCQKLFGSVRAPFWKERAFNAQRAFGRIDSHGRIYMLLPPQDGQAHSRLLSSQPVFRLNRSEVRQK